jgi:hypothetical protein
MQFAPMVVNLLGFKVNNMDRMATLSFAPLQQIDIFESNKRNQGFGEQNGDLTAINVPINYVVDTDLLDSGSQKTSVV